MKTAELGLTQNARTCLVECEKETAGTRHQRCWGLAINGVDIGAFTQPDDHIDGLSRPLHHPCTRIRPCRSSPSPVWARS